MESVLQRFVDFVEMNNHNVCNADIDILPFIEVVDRTTPAIKNSVTEEEGYPLCFRAMPEIVLINFCRNVGDITFPMSGLLALKDIVTKDVDDEDSRLSMILLIHLTKMQFSIRDAAMYYSDFTCIIGNVDTTDARCWLEIGNLVLAHTTVSLPLSPTRFQFWPDWKFVSFCCQIIKSINNLLKNVFGQQFAERVDKTESVPITVKMVDTRESQLRGFTGINQIYINYGCFITKKFQIDRSTLSNELKTMLIIIDVATVAIHEYAHARAQQVTKEMMEYCNIGTHSLPLGYR